MSVYSYDRFSETEIFIQVVEFANFSEVARHLNLSPSTISKMIMRLEKRLGTALFHRTTRKLTLTAAGEYYYKHTLNLLHNLDQIENHLQSQHGSVRGKVRITCSIPFALHQIIDKIPALKQLNPDIEIILLTTDQVVDLLEERCDIAIRIGHLKDSNLKMRKLADSHMFVVASPHYLKKYGVPKTPQELHKHHCLHFHGHPELNSWPFKQGHQTLFFSVKNTFSMDNGEGIRRMLLTHHGIARLSAFMVREDINRGKLIPLLEPYNPKILQPIYLLYHNKPSARVKFVINFFLTAFQEKLFA